MARREPTPPKPRRGRPRLGGDKRQRLVAFVEPGTHDTIATQASAEGIAPGKLAGRLLDGLLGTNKP